jgi:hypothetical protein
MPRNSGGTYSLPAGNPVITGTVISSTVQNNTMNDVATALTQSIASTGVTTPSANLPMGGFRHTVVGNATALTCYTSATDVQNGSIVTLSAVSGTDTITATAPLSMAAYAAGQRFNFVAAATNTGAVTININLIGAKSITKAGTAMLNAGDILSGQVVEIIYDGTRFQMIGARQGASVGALVVNARSSNTIFGTADLGSMNQFTSTFTQTFDAAATLGSGWYVDVQNIGTGVITFDANGSETFNTPSGARTTICLYPGEGYRIVSNATGFDLVGRSDIVTAYSYTSGGADATIDLEIGFTDTETASVEIEYYGVTGSSDLMSRVKKSGAYVTSGSYGYALGYASGTAAITNAGTATAWFSNATSAGGGTLRYGRLWVTKPSATLQVIQQFSAATGIASIDAYGNNGAIVESTSAALQGIRFYLASGNITTGTFTIRIYRA